jgi:LEA14-like dessication related protein
MKRTLAYASLLTLACVGLALVTVALSGCAAIRQTLNIENPRYSIRNISPRVDIALPLSASSIDIDFAIEVDNPNSVGLRLDQVDFNLFINDNRVLDSISQQNIQIPANGRGDVNLRTRIGYQNVRSLWSEIVNVIQGNRARYELRGNAYYNTPIGRMKFPVTVYSSR